MDKKMNSAATLETTNSLAKDDPLNDLESVSGFKPLHIAALKCYPDKVKRLLQMGCDVNDRTPSGLTALHLAMGRVDAGGDIATLNDLIEYVCEDSIRRSKVIASLIKAGADVNIKDSLGMTPLYYATFPTLEPIFEQVFHRVGDPLPKEDDPLLTLLSLGASVRVNQAAADYDGQLPLQNAIKNCKIRVILDLLRFGADLADIEPAYVLNIPYIPPITYLGQYWERRMLVERDGIDEICRYVSKLNVARLPAIEIPDVDDYPIAGTIPYDEYSDEVEKLKSYFIDGRISLYDWLHLNYTKAQPCYLSGVPPEFESMFPHYYEIILARYRMVMECIPLLEPAKLAFYQITKSDLLEICVEHILFYLSNKDLYFLVDCLENN